MLGPGLLQIGLLVVALALCLRPIGAYMAKVFGGGAAPGDRLFAPIERVVYRLTGVDPESEQRWTTYAYSVLGFSLFSVLLVYGFQRMQSHLPLNPTGALAVKPLLALNTAWSFTTNTNWQNYVPESTAGVSHFTQMGALVVQNFVSAAVGVAVAMAVMRGLVRRQATTVGNFWVDLTRATVRLFLPLAVAAALVLVSQGAIQNLRGFHTVQTVDGATQEIPGGPFASQEAIKEAGQNGGGPLNANSAHPLENPNPFTNLFEIFLILLIPFALTYTFGRLVGNQRQGYVLLGVMVVIWLATAAALWGFEAHGNPRLQAVGADERISATNPGGSLEGKEARFGPAASGLFVASTTNTSTGAVNAQHDSLTPGGGGVAIVDMALSEVTPGGSGSGLYGMLILAILAVFIAGLMVGRTPEYLGKKIEPTDMKFVVLYILVQPAVILVFASLAVLLATTKASVFNPGAHGLSEVIYGFLSPTQNNGSAFGGLAANTNFFNVTQSVAMFVGRFLLIIPALALAGNLARKRTVPASAGTFPTDSLVFGGLLFGVIVIVTALTYFPALSLGPIVEHLGL